jgi:hypothetical protein
MRQQRNLKLNYQPDLMAASGCKGVSVAFTLPADIMLPLWVIPFFACGCNLNVKRMLCSIRQYRVRKHCQVAPFPPPPLSPQVSRTNSPLHHLLVTVNFPCLSSNVPLRAAERCVILYAHTPGPTKYHVRMITRQHGSPTAKQIA